MPVRRASPLKDTAFQSRSRERLNRLKETEKRGAFPVSTPTMAQQIASKSAQTKILKKSGDI